MLKFSTGIMCISFFIVTVAAFQKSHDDVIMTTLAKLSTDLLELKKTVSDQNDKLASLESENEKLKRFCASERNSDVAVNKRLLLMNQDHPSHTKAAFTARLSSHITGLGSSQAIIFDDVESNFGNCYSPNTGAFTAITNGTYFFFASMMSHANEYLETEIVKNGVRVALMYNYVPNTFDQGVNAAVLGLAEGDAVWVRHVGQEGSKVYGGSWCSFSGFQIE